MILVEGICSQLTFPKAILMMFGYSSAGLSQPTIKTAQQSFHYHLYQEYKVIGWSVFWGVAGWFIRGRAAIFHSQYTMPYIWIRQIDWKTQHSCEF